MNEIILSPSDFAALLNQTLEMAFPFVVIEGELSNFRVSKNRWVYFDLKDEAASVAFFGSVYQLPGPLEDGLKVRVVGAPRLHPRFGFSISFQSIQPVGEGALKKASDLLAAKLDAEGLFDIERKRPLPELPEHIGLITAVGSAAYGDFVKIINARWGGLRISVIDVLVQGDKSPGQLVRAIEHFNKSARPPEVLVITRGGGSAEDLASFSDERVTRAVAASRIPTLVAIGHEVDISLAELAADMRASTPTNAAGLVVPDRAQILTNLEHERRHISARLKDMHQLQVSDLKELKSGLAFSVTSLIENQHRSLESLKTLARLFDPRQALKRGYAIVTREGRHISKVSNIKVGQQLAITLSDGKIISTVNKVTKGSD